MFLTQQAIEKAFLLLIKLNTQNGKAGKSRKEKVSALRHLLATSLVLKKIQPATAALDLAVEKPSNRRAFTNAVGEIVSIDGGPKYTADFAGEFAEKKGFSVGSNFLTTIVAATRNGRGEEYPGRPAALLDITDEKISIKHDVKNVLESYYNLKEFRAPLVIWLLRTTDIPVKTPIASDELHTAVATFIDSNFEPLVRDAITPTQQELETFLNVSGLTTQELFGTTKAKHASVVNADLNATSTSQSASDINAIVHEALHDFGAANLRLPLELIQRFLASLLTKRFVIVTGLSGSGKTKLSQAFATWISESKDQYRIVAVGADWTSSENILGYLDALQDGIYRKPANGALDLILRAATDSDHPYFLILDEMNLSHVERYFADILSALESGQEIALHSSISEIDGVPIRVALPDNLFIIGTVNVDETTYMFSPKVLDRANVIEFRAASYDIATFLEKPLPVRLEELEAKGSDFSQAFVETARKKDIRLGDLPIEITGGKDYTSDLKTRVVELFDDLSKIGAEFGFRTALEISRFVYFHAVLSGPGWQFNKALDAQILQKLLPKLHGSERRLRPILEKINTFCERHGCIASQEKIGRMLDRLKDGFTSFAEA